MKLLLIFLGILAVVSALGIYPSYYPYGYYGYEPAVRALNSYQYYDVNTVPLVRSGYLPYPYPIYGHLPAESTSVVEAKSAEEHHSRRRRSPYRASRIPEYCTFGGQNMPECHPKD